MSIDRQVEEMVARCVGIAVFYHGERTAKAKAAMEAEFRTVAARVAEVGLGVDALHDRFLRPLEVEFAARYGAEEGRRLHAGIVRALEATAALPCPVLS